MSQEEIKQLREGKYIFTQPLCHGQDVTPSQLFKQNKAGFPSPRLVV